jgi:hypothetical protein
MPVVRGRHRQADINHLIISYNHHSIHQEINYDPTDDKFETSPPQIYQFVVTYTPVLSDMQRHPLTPTINKRDLKIPRICSNRLDRKAKERRRTKAGRGVSVNLNVPSARESG